MSRHRHTWTPADEAILRAEYGRTPTRDIASRIGVTTTAVRQRALKLGLHFAPVWTPERLEALRTLYATHSGQECADALGVSLNTVWHAVNKLGLRKSRDWIVERSRFKPGMTPHNKGKPHPSRGRAVETQFKKGMRPHTWQPIGHTRETKDGYLQRKVSDTRCTRRDYVGIHHLVWRMHGNTVPPDHALVFADGDKRNFDINNLALIPRAELMRRNSVHRHGPEVARAYQLIGAVRRQINRRSRGDTATTHAEEATQ